MTYVYHWLDDGVPSTSSVTIRGDDVGLNVANKSGVFPNMLHCKIINKRTEGTLLILETDGCGSTGVRDRNMYIQGNTLKMPLFIPAPLTRE